MDIKKRRRTRSVLLSLGLVLTMSFLLNVGQADALKTSKQTFTLVGSEENGTTLTQTFNMPVGMKYIDKIVSEGNEKVDFTVDQTKNTFTVNIDNVKGVSTQTTYTGMQERYMHMGGKSALVSGPLDIVYVGLASQYAYVEVALTGYTDLNSDRFTVNNGFSRAEIRPMYSGTPDYWIINGYYFENYYSADFAVRTYSGSIVKRYPRAVLTVDFSDERHYWSEHPIAQEEPRTRLVAVREPQLVNESSPLKLNPGYQRVGNKFELTGTAKALSISDTGYSVGGTREILGETVDVLYKYTLVQISSGVNLYERVMYISGPAPTKGSFEKITTNPSSTSYPAQGISSGSWYTYLGNKAPTKEFDRWRRYSASVTVKEESDWSTPQLMPFGQLPPYVYVFFAGVQGSSFSLSTPVKIDFSTMGGVRYTYGEDATRRNIYRWEKTAEGTLMRSSKSLNFELKKDKLLSTVEDYSGTYPDKGFGFDEYYYEKIFPKPELDLTAQPQIYVSEVSGRSVFNVTGVIADADGSKVTVTSTVAGKAKSVVVTAKGIDIPVPFTLSWDARGDSIPEGTYGGIVVKAQNLDGFEEKTSNLVVVVDKTKPALNPVVIFSNGMHKNFAKLGDQVSLNFVTNETLSSTMTVRVGGTTIVPVSTGNSYTASLGVTNSIAEGLLAFSISVEDLAGNKTAVSSTTDSSFVKFYKTPPKLTNVNIKSSGGDVKRAKVGDKVILSFALDREWNSTPLALIAGRPSNIVSSSGNVYVFETNMVASDKEGFVEFSIGPVMDAAGNSAVDTSATTDESFVEFDKTPPTLTQVSIRTDESGKAELTIVASEELRAEPKVSLNGETFVLSRKDGLTYVYVSVGSAKDFKTPLSLRIEEYEDLAGNAGSLVTETTDGSELETSDRTSPQFKTVTIYSSNSDTAKAVVGDTVFVDFTLNKELGDNFKPNASIAGIRADVIKLGEASWRASRILLPTDKAGILSFELETGQDENGNFGDIVKVSTDNTQVLFTKAVKGLSSVTAKSSNATPTMARIADTGTFVVVAEDTLYDIPKLFVNGVQAAVKANTAMTEFIYTYPFTSEDVEGKVAIEITNVIDSGGGSASSMEGTTDGSFIVFDKTPPRVKDLRVSGGTKVGETLTMLLDVSEELKGIPTVLIGDKIPTVVKTSVTSFRITQVVTSDMIGKINFRIDSMIDLAGNVGSPVTELSNGGTVTSESGNTIIITLTGIENGKVYSGGAIPIFSATSPLSKEVTVSATLDGKQFKSGSSANMSGTHTLIITARDEDDNQEVLSVSFSVTK